MSKHSEFDKAAAAKKMYARPRKSAEIQQEYANVASNLGDTHFAVELKRADIQKLTLRLGELKDEHEAAVVYEKEQKEKGAAAGDDAIEAAAPETMTKSMPDEAQL